MTRHNQALTLSIVIPAYNEERYLGECLKSIANQTVPPDEVIVVDNNSTDGTRSVAEEFPFVKIVQEKKQGRAHARNKGFNLSRSDIIGRIDADVILAQDWVHIVKEAFRDPTISAISGPARTYTIPIILKPRSVLWSRMYFLIMNAVSRLQIVWGSNMALRSSAWEKIASNTCLDDTVVHEDIDISYLLAGRGLRVKYVPNLIINKDGEDYFEWAKYAEYVKRCFQTKNHHKKRGTLNSAQALRLSYGYSIAALAVAIVPWVLFSIASYLYALSARLIHTSKVNKP